MPQGGVDAEIEFDKLSEYLKALSNPNRLELLYQLRFPHTASEIHLTPKRTETEGNPDRFISRQAVERHLGVLEGIGVIRRAKSTRDGRPVEEFVVNHPKLFAIVEEMKKITHIKSFKPLDPLATAPGAPAPAAAVTAASAPQVKGPRLLLVSGVFEGRTYALTGPGPWRLGRREGSEVRLDYDPFVSTDNTVIVREGGSFLVQDVETSRNGTSVNYELVTKGGARALENGDLVGVGRSLLLFRDG